MYTYTIRRLCARNWRFAQLSRTVLSDSASHGDVSLEHVSILEHPHIIDQIPLEDVRQFCFIAHVDHGKSSLSSRILELTGNMGKEAQELSWNLSRDIQIPGARIYIDKKSREKIEILDTLAVEKQRGITVKTATASMLFKHPSAVGPSGTLLINMYDTPGHSDFGKEVTRSLNFVQGAVLLLDATQGIQAQTWSVHDKVKALPNPPKLLIALTKVDLEAAKPIQTALTVSEWLNWDDPDSIILTSARNRIGIKDILDAVCEKVPPPTPLPDDDHKLLRIQVVDSTYDARGVVSTVQILSGELKENQRLTPAKSQGKVTSFPAQEVGLVLPKHHRTGSLRRGQMGYVRFGGMKDTRQSIPGTIFTTHEHASNKDMVLPDLPVDISAKSVLYASVHPEETDGFEELCNAVERLALNDTGLEVQMTSSLGSSEHGGPFLGPGLRVGFQGLLHIEVFRQRLMDEFGIEAIVTPPKVTYQITHIASRTNNLTESYSETIEDLAKWPASGTKFLVQEPMVNAKIVARVEDTGAVLDLIQRNRGSNIESEPIDEDKWIFRARIPWAEVVTDFHDTLKNVTAGYGSLDTTEANPPFEQADLCKVEILLNGDVVEPLAFVSHKDAAQAEARKVVTSLQKVLPREQFMIVIQAKADGKIIASERIKAYRKDVLTKSGKVVGGGDMTRKMKLLEKQKKGKKRMQQSGKVSLSQAAFNSVISRRGE